MSLRKANFRALVVMAAATTMCGAVLAQNAICYNCPPEWADWGSQIKAIKADTGITVPPDNKNSGQSLAQLVAEKSSPVADVTYVGVTFAIQAQKDGVVTAYKPATWNEIPDGLKDPKGEWFTIHSGTLGFMVNKAALGNKPVPKSWADLLKPEYKGLIAYLDPSSAFVGYVGAVAVNEAMGGSMDNFTPALNYFKQLQKNEPIVPKQTSYARLLSGEFGILLDYDFNAYRAKYKDHANVEFVIPQEGTVVMPYVMSLVKNSPNAENGKKVLDYVLSDKGQSLWANAYLRPVRDVKMPKEVASHFLPASEYARAKSVDYRKMAEVQKSFSTRYLREVR
ncbi:ABC transporter substrate-binding protein [Comamonas sp. CMM03]|uniref:ABC transporter substrate-binding protein n=1 Tax=Comamonas sp. CMM03 TaxID=2854781 RepID=UPI001C437562|nr:ABC transporter substrate-binding protein [Comamonas sp. CMM03]MBV7417196.1 ABC transporter substrate-binding protein [Comamonas sp. CMM03]